MTSRGGPSCSLEFLTEPTFVLRRSGTVVDLNGAARRLLGTDCASDLFEHVESPAEDLRGYLRRSSASSSPIIGSATLRTRDGPTRFRLSCARMTRRAGDGRLVLRCHPLGDDQFSMLRRQVRSLDAQLRDRTREKVILEEALRENRELLRELQHRVKNNIQLTLSLLQITARGRETQEVRELLEGARSRLQAMASAQDSIYRSTHGGSVAAGPLLGELASAIAQSAGASGRLHLEIVDAPLPSDLANGLALIANELITNAVKHGSPDAGGTLRVIFTPDGDELSLVVHDSGPGIGAEAESRSSGLKLVRALCRQIGGVLEIVNDGGARCEVRFRAGREWSSS